MGGLFAYKTQLCVSYHCFKSIGYTFNWYNLKQYTLAYRVCFIFIIMCVRCQQGNLNRILWWLARCLIIQRQYANNNNIFIFVLGVHVHAIEQ